MPEKVQVAVRLPSAATKMIDQLAGSILGTNRGEVARNLIIDQLQVLAAQGVVEWLVDKEADATSSESGAANSRKSPPKGAD